MKDTFRIWTPIVYFNNAMQLKWTKKLRNNLKAISLDDADFVGNVQCVVVGRQLNVSFLLPVRSEKNNMAEELLIDRKSKMVCARLQQCSITVLKICDENWYKTLRFV